jgi:hypothetical protein
MTDVDAGAAPAWLTREKLIADIQALFNQSQLLPDVELELARLVELVIQYPEVEDENRNQSFYQMIQAAVKALADTDPKLLFARSIRNRLTIRVLSSGPSWAARVRTRVGDQPINAMLAGLLCSIIPWAVIFIPIWAVCHYGAHLEQASPLGLVVLAAMGGASVSIISRLGDVAELTVFDPLHLFVSATLKPIAASLFAISIYAVLASGFLTITGVTVGKGPEYMVWVVGFLAGFSERFAPDFVSKFENAFGASNAPKPTQVVPAGG